MVYWDIDKAFEEMRRRMNFAFDSMFDDLNDQNLLTNKNDQAVQLSHRAPITDMYEREKDIVARIEMPGLDKKDISLQVKNDHLIVKGEKKQEKEDEKKGYYTYERSYSGFNRSLPLPDNVDESKIKAHYKDGLLEVIIPKTEDKKGGVKYIDIG